jgi:S1-C subfamily serine protease
MRVHAPFFIAALLLVGAAPSLTGAQIRRSTSDAGTMRRSRIVATDTDTPDPRTMLGLVVGTSGTDRDTLGLLVTQVLRDGPAERAGIDEGNRIAEIDGVSLRIDPNDIGRSTAADAAMRRLGRTLAGLRDADQARLRVYGGGRYRTVTVQLGGGAVAPNAVAAAGATAAPVAVPAPNVAVAGEPSRTAPTVTTAIQSVTDLQAQLRRLADDQSGTPLGDSLAQSARDLGLVQRRLRAAQAEQRRRVEDQGDRTVSRRAGADVPGLSLSTVSDDLSDYFGDGSAGGLLVLQAESSWDPIRPGDVILNVDGSPATIDRLRDAADARRPVRIDLLRRRRQMTVTLHDREDDR